MKEKKRRGRDCNTYLACLGFCRALCRGWELDILDEDKICLRGDDIKRGSKVLRERTKCRLCTNVSCSLTFVPIPNLIDKN